MTVPSVNHDTFVIERFFSAAPERVFAAWADPAKKRSWFAESEDSTLETFEADFRVGGVERSLFRFKGSVLMGNITYYHDIVAGRRIVASYAMTANDKPFSVSLMTVELEAEGEGTRMRFTEQAAFFEGGDGSERRRQGWSELLGRLEATLLAR